LNPRLAFGQRLPRTRNTRNVKDIGLQNSVSVPRRNFSRFWYINWNDVRFRKFGRSGLLVVSRVRVLTQAVPVISTRTIIGNRVCNVLR
jgi:hypothetical protein